MVIEYEYGSGIVNRTPFQLVIPTMRDDWILVYIVRQWCEKALQKFPYVECLERPDGDALSSGKLKWKVRLHFEHDEDALAFKLKWL
jgi:hypothetical protein